MSDLPQIATEIRTFLDKNILLIVSGPLGVGKTTLIREIVPGARSPSFLHMLIYETEYGNFAHIDAYTFQNNREILQLGLEDLLPKMCVIVEWGELVNSELNLYNAKQIKLQLDYHEFGRIIEIEV